MPKASNRNQILTAGLQVVHERGYGAASVRDIVRAAGVPQGSFTNHFASKEAFGLAILELYWERAQVLVAATLRNDALPPLQRLRTYIESSTKCPEERGTRNGCLFGNFSAEASDHSEVIRRRLVEIFEAASQSIAYCLRAAVAAGEISRETDCEEVAGFVVSSLQGAILLAKAERGSEPIARFTNVLFAAVLAPGPARA